MITNTKNNQFYSRIEIACCLQTSLPNFNKEQCLYSSDCDVYSREFIDLESTIMCIYEIEKAWEAKTKITESNISNDLNNNECGSLMLYNRWKKMLDIEIYSGKWRFSGFSKYTQEWVENIISDKVSGKDSQFLVAYVPDINEVNEDEFISKKRVIEFIREWLEIGNISTDFDGDRCLAYMKEIWGT
jgi:hypothetical protein